MFLESLPYTITIPELRTILVHAGIDPRKPITEQHPDYMVRMRNIVNGEPTHLTVNGSQWVDIYERSNQTTRIIFGHDSRRRLQQGSKYLGIDTGAVYGDKLTAMIRYPNGSEQFISVQSQPYSPVSGPIIHT